jgi:hypothetical protein
MQRKKASADCMPPWVSGMHRSLNLILAALLLRQWTEVACAASQVTDLDIASVELVSGEQSISGARRDFGVLGCDV